MPSAFPRSPRLTKGALVQILDGVAGPETRVIDFQFNPESISRKFTSWEPHQPPEQPEGEARSDPQVQPYDPEETIDLELLFDATDDLEEPAQNPIAAEHGVAHRLATLERMLYPVRESGGLRASVGAVLGGSASGAVPRAVVPVVLFSFGEGLIVPVRIMGFSVTESQHAPSLAPTRATVALSLKVLTDLAFAEDGVGAQSGRAAALARAAYRYTRQQRDNLADADQGDGAGNALSRLPF